jgi:hypothetical protein
VEGAMRRVFVASGAIAVAIIGYAVSPGAAQTSGDAPIAVGDRIRLWYPDSGSGIKCTVASVRSDFVHCAPEQGDPFAPVATRDEWFNLRTLRSFERLANDRRGP